MNLLFKIAELTKDNCLYGTITHVQKITSGKYSPASYFRSVLLKGKIHVRFNFGELWCNFIFSAGDAWVDVPLLYILQHKLQAIQYVTCFENNNAITLQNICISAILLKVYPVKVPLSHTDPLFCASYSCSLYCCKLDWSNWQ